MYIVVIIRIKKHESCESTSVNVDQRFGRGSETKEGYELATSCLLPCPSSAFLALRNMLETWLPVVNAFKATGSEEATAEPISCKSFWRVKHSRPSRCGVDEKAVVVG